MKTSVSLRAPRLVALLAFAFASLSLSNLSAQTTVSTVPVGAVGVTIAAGTGVARTLSTVSFPLVDEAVVAGKVRGVITSVTANTISNSTAGWTPAQLSAPAAPCLIQITSGTAAGRMFLVSTTTASTATTVTIDTEESSVVDLTTLGIVAGTDTYRVLACDTLNSLFGNGVQTNASSANADIVLVLRSGAYTQYFHNGSNWVRVGPPGNQNNTPIRPDSMVIFNRLGATPLSFTITGEVPSIARKAIVRNGGLTVLSTGWPTTQTLLSSGISSIPGWVSGAVGVADKVLILQGTAYTQYYNNGTNWVRVGPPGNQNATVIPVGSGVILNKLGSATGSSVLTQALPYTL